MNVEKLIEILVRLALVENPNLNDGTEANQEYLQGLKSMAQLYVEVSAEGRVAGPDADAVLLATIGYEESRHRPKSKDGDCNSYNLKGELVCNAVGPMQVSKSTPLWLREIDPSWRGVTLAELREPRKNVEAAYAVLEHWSNACSGSTNEMLLGNWSAGRCLKGAIAMGTHRCHLANAIGKEIGVEVGECKRAPAKRTRKLMKRIAETKTEKISG